MHQQWYWTRRRGRAPLANLFRRGPFSGAAIEVSGTLRQETDVRVLLDRGAVGLALSRRPAPAIRVMIVDDHQHVLWGWTSS